MEPREIIKKIGIPASKIAIILGVSLDAVKSWQCGRRNPEEFYMKALSSLLLIPKSELQEIIAKKQKSQNKKQKSQNKRKAASVKKS
jgi:hypothetical protein